jgi:hypothetical protein
MDRIEDEGMTLLAPLRDTEPGAESGVDIASALRVGRRRSRRRVVAGALAAAVVTALALVAVPAALKSWHGTVEPAVVPGEFSIARHAITVGTAGGFKNASLRTGRYEQVAELTRADGAPGYGRVTAYAPGRNPKIDTSVRAADVNGRRAYWQPGLPEPTLAMREGDIWVIVRASGPDMDIVDRAHRVAQAVEINPDLPVEVCFTLKALPTWMREAGFRVVGVQVPTSQGVAYILFGTSDATGSPVLSIGAGRGFPPLSPNDTVNGFQAHVNSDSVTLYNLDGRGSGAVVRYEYANGIGGSAVLKQLVTAVELVSDVGDRDTWVEYH